MQLPIMANVISNLLIIFTDPNPLPYIYYLFYSKVYTRRILPFLLPFPGRVKFFYVPHLMNINIHNVLSSIFGGS